MNRQERREINKKHYIRNLKRWMNEDGGCFWGRSRNFPKNELGEIRDTAESWVELKEHGGGIWKLKKNNGGWHGPDKVMRAERKKTNKEQRRNKHGLQGESD